MAGKFTDIHLMTAPASGLVPQVGAHDAHFQQLDEADERQADVQAEHAADVGQ